MSSNKRQRTLLGNGGAIVGIQDIPEPILTSISTYLAVPSRILLAVALTAHPSEWAKPSNAHGEPHEPSSMGKAVMASVPPLEEFDFACMGEGMAHRLGDGDLGGILMCIDAANKLTRLWLTHCVNMTGAGLKMLGTSTVMEEIDLSIDEGKDDEGEGEETNKKDKSTSIEHSISASEVFPILERILFSRKGSSLQELKLHKKWQSGINEELDALLEKGRGSYRENHWSPMMEIYEAGCFRCDDRWKDYEYNHSLRPGSRTLNTYLWGGEADDEKKKRTCPNCGIYFCDSCHSREYPETCQECREFTCAECRPYSECVECDGVYHTDCAIVSWSSAGPICKECSEPQCPCSSGYRIGINTAPSCSVCKCFVRCSDCSPDGIQTIQYCLDCCQIFCPDCRLVNENGTCCQCFKAPSNLPRITQFFSKK